MNSFISNFLKLVLYTPDGRCPGCGKILFLTEDFLCTSCRNNLKPALQRRCPRCGSALFNEEDRLCPACLKDERSKALSGGFVLYESGRKAEEIVRTLKSGTVPDMLYYFGEELGEAFLKDKSLIREVFFYTKPSERKLLEGFLSKAHLEEDQDTAVSEKSCPVVLMLSLQEKRENLYASAAAFLSQGTKKVYCASVFAPG